MKHTVLWSSQAEASFMSSMLRSLDRPAQWKSAHAINERLASDPSTAGESRGGGWRLMFERPYSALYFVDDENRTVYVEQIKWVGP